MDGISKKIIMEYQKIINVLNQPPKLRTSCWVEIIDESSGTYNNNWIMLTT